MAADEWSAERAVAAAVPRTFQGTVWRTHWRAVQPIDWSLSLRTSGRYHRGLDLFPAAEAFAALYTSLAPEIAIWEMVRRSAAQNLAFLENNILSELTAVLRRALDLSDPASLGLAPAALTARDPRPCQAIAAAALARGYEGLLVPSAALPGLNLVLLPANLPNPLPVQVVRQTELPIELLEQAPRATLSDEQPE
jgi:RES domain-containing protein